MNTEFESRCCDDNELLYFPYQIIVPVYCSRCERKGNKSLQLGAVWRINHPGLGHPLNQIADCGVEGLNKFRGTTT